LAVQIAAVLHEALKTVPKVQIYRGAKVTPNTLTRALSGEGLRLDTLEKFCRVLRWHVLITDEYGETVAVYPSEALQGVLPQGREGP